MAARPRPIPRARSATRGHLLREFEVRIGSRAVRIVVDDGPAEAGCLAKPDVPGYHRVEDERWEMPAHFGLDVLRQLGAGIVHRQQHARYRQTRVELALDQGKRVEQ